MEKVFKQFAPLRSFVKFRHSAIETSVTIENLIFKFHYRITVLILFVGSVLVTSKEYFGEHIKCVIQGSIPQKVIDSFCFFTTTYTVVKHNNITSLRYGDIPHPGVGPVPHYSNEPIIRHAYYQWVPFVLFFQAFFFYLPHIIWKSKEGGRLRALVIHLKFAHFSLSDKSFRVNKNYIPSIDEKYMTKKFSIFRNRSYSYLRKVFTSKIYNKPWSNWLVLCELLNFINLILQIYFTNIFLRGHFLSLGIKVWRDGLISEIDILDEVFPKVTKCDFYKYGPSGSQQKHDALCVMALNVVNEKIYLILWFWFLTLFIITLLGLIWRLLTYMFHSTSNTFNRLVFSFACPGNIDPWELVVVTKNTHFSDWLILYYIAKNLDGRIFKEFFTSLAHELDGRMNSYNIVDRHRNYNDFSSSKNPINASSIDEVDSMLYPNLPTSLHGSEESNKKE